MEYIKEILYPDKTKIAGTIGVFILSSWNTIFLLSQKSYEVGQGIGFPLAFIEVQKTFPEGGSESTNPGFFLGPELVPEAFIFNIFSIYILASLIVYLYRRRK